MPSVTCPTCGERGKIAPTLIGARIKCKKCGNSFMVAPPAGKPAVASSTSPTPVTQRHHGIEVEGLDASSWTLSTETGDALGAEATAELDQSPDSSAAFIPAGSSPAESREYKLLTPKDKIFDGKFDMARLEDALNHYARQGWVVKAMATPHIKNFSGVLEETVVVLLER